VFANAFTLRKREIALCRIGRLTVPFEPKAMDLIQIRR
jgi:hypothetical protein